MLAKLKQYKELISILVFFLGGFFWIDSQYPKKSDLADQVSGVDANLSGQIVNLQCLLKEYMKLTQLQISAREAERLVDDLTGKVIQSQESFAGVEVADLSPAMRIIATALEDDLSRAREDFTEIADKISDIQEGLQLQDCGSR